MFTFCCLCRHIFLKNCFCFKSLGTCHCLLSLSSVNDLWQMSVFVFFYKSVARSIYHSSSFCSIRFWILQCIFFNFFPHLNVTVVYNAWLAYCHLFYIIASPNWDYVHGGVFTEWLEHYSWWIIGTHCICIKKIWHRHCTFFQHWSSFMVIRAFSKHYPNYSKLITISPSPCDTYRNMA